MATFASQISFVLLFALLATTFNRSLQGTSKRVIRCNENDERLISIFKEGVVDPNNRLSSWSVEHDCCSWEGVWCDNVTGRVIKVDLALHGLEGEVNLCVLQLEFLTHFNLSYNDFGTVSMLPCQISKSAFDSHKFHNRSLETPSNHSTSFSLTPRYLDFSKTYHLVINDLHWLSQLTSLKYLDLSDSDISDIGNETKWLQHISMLPSLSQLRLRSCGLRDFPSMDYLNFTSLEVLDLSYNFYMMNPKLPESFFNITNHIYHLDLHGCSFYGQLPKALLNLQHLKHLDLSFNNLQGSIPDWFGQYEQMEYLDIEGNLFSGVIPSSLGNISSLLNLDLSHNQLSGNLPETLGALHNLNQLHIGHNFLAGIIMEMIFSDLSNLTSLDLSSTSFEFNIDSKWIPLFQLKYLDLTNTSIGPNVPTWLYTQQPLTYLDISRSQISKNDADVFWSFIAAIDYVDISNNMISDDISNATLSPNISHFDASHNSLSGSISSLLCQLDSNEESELCHLDLSYNHLSGALPDCCANLKHLDYINLGSNKITGGVPTSLASLVNRVALDLSDNSFFGEFSFDMQNWTTLEYLFLERNKFLGSLPNPYMAKDLQIIELRSNQFTGNMPSQLCNLPSLTILDLAENKLSGSIPHCLYNITNVKRVRIWLHEIEVFTKGRELHYQSSLLPALRSGIIDLSGNSLSGKIPEELFSISHLLSLNLARNHLIGKIPKEIGGMGNLESLDLSYNRLSGEIPSTISNLSFLACLNLSYNNFIGQIPLGTQIQSFDPWSFVGNDELCGDPLPKKCSKKEETHDPEPAEGNEDDGFMKSLYMGMGVGFAVGFWGICGSLFLIRAWRHNFFRWFGHLVDQLYVALALCFKRFDRLNT